MKVLAAILLLIALSGAIATKNRPAKIHTIDGRAMGCSWRLAWRGDAPAPLRPEVAGVLEHWEQVLSTWREDSDLSHHRNGAPPTPDLARVLALAHKLQTTTGGAFHPSADPVRGLDLGGIGKGFAVDRVSARLRALGIHDFVFELGGEVLAGDGSWQVAVAHPLGGTATTVILQNRAMATSGNYHQPRHLIDPRTGRPVTGPPRSVTVYAATAADADAWATALFIRGPGHAPANAPAHHWNGT